MRYILSNIKKNSHVFVLVVGFEKLLFYNCCFYTLNVLIKVNFIEDIKKIFLLK